MGLQSNSANQRCWEQQRSEEDSQGDTQDPRAPDAWGCAHGATPSPCGQAATQRRTPRSAPAPWQRRTHADSCPPGTETDDPLRGLYVPVGVMKWTGAHETRINHAVMPRLICYELCASMLRAFPTTALEMPVPMPWALQMAGLAPSNRRRALAGAVWRCSATKRRRSLPRSPFVSPAVLCVHCPQKCMRRFRMSATSVIWQDAEHLHPQCTTHKHTRTYT